MYTDMGKDCKLKKFGSHEIAFASVTWLQSWPASCVNSSSSNPSCKDQLNGFLILPQIYYGQTNNSYIGYLRLEIQYFWACMSFIIHNFRALKPDVPLQQAKLIHVRQGSTYLCYGSLSSP